MTITERYLQRIGFTGSTHVSEATLAAVAGAHAATIPFENVASFAGSGVSTAAGAGAAQLPVSLAVDDLAAKLLNPSAPRGGYCLEHAGLVATVLPELGFPVRHILARTFLDPDAGPSARTHNVVIAVVAGREFLFDTGLGGLTPTAPLALDRVGAQDTPHGQYRLVPAEQSRTDLTDAPDIEFMVQALLRKPDGEVWSNLYGFADSPVSERDREVANWFIATSPQSPFTRGFAAALAPADGSRLTISGTTMRRRDRGDATKQEIESPQQLSDALGEVGVALPAAELADFSTRLLGP